MYNAEFVARICAWNGQRYEQKSNAKLTMALLCEELEELVGSSDEVEALDAIGDLIYVAVGALWKLGFTAEQIRPIFTAITWQDLQSASGLLDYGFRQARYLMTALEGDWAYYEEAKEDSALISTLVLTVFTSIIPSLNALGRTTRLDEIMTAICDSNDSKAVPETKVDPSVKANSGKSGKGPNYIAPTEALTLIAESLKDGEF